MTRDCLPLVEFPQDEHDHFFATIPKQTHSAHVVTRARILSKLKQGRTHQEVCLAVKKMLKSAVLIAGALFICASGVAQDTLEIAGCRIRPGTLCTDMNLNSIDLHGRDLSNSQFSRANLISANFRGSNLDAANLTSADLRKADLRQALLNDADLRAANLRNVYEITSRTHEPACGEIVEFHLGKIESSIIFMLVFRWSAALRPVS